MNKKNGLRDIENKAEIKVFDEFIKNLWLRYVPEKALFAYRVIVDISNAGLKGEKAEEIIMNAAVNEVQQDAEQKAVALKLEEERKKLIQRLGYKYPESRKEEIELLLKFGLIQKYTDEANASVYDIVWPIPHPTAVIEMDMEERQELRRMSIEYKLQNSINAILNEALEAEDGILRTTLEQLQTDYEVPFGELKEALKFLQEEGSIEVKNNRKINMMRKKDKLYLVLNKEVLNQKRILI